MANPKTCQVRCYARYGIPSLSLKRYDMLQVSPHFLLIIFHAKKSPYEHECVCVHEHEYVCVH